MGRAAPPELFQRHADNPIITARDLPYAANAVFNPASVVVEGETILLLRVEDRRGFSHLTVARSENGLSGWRIDPEPTFPARPDTHPEEAWGVEDPRITYVDEQKRWYIAYTAYSRGGPLVSLAWTEDWKTFTRLGPVMAPEDKDAALFPRRFDGRWVLIHRPVPGAAHFGAHIWISYSPDLKHWGDHQILLRARFGGWWDANKIGLSPQPMLTERGWLIMYHGVRTTAAGCLYRSGLALLDKDDPRKVLRRSREWVLAPMTPYERSGDVSDVVFSCGWTLVGNEIRCYYGAADTCVCVATGHLDQVLEWLDGHADEA
jgi:predicted GH43/DUF377 family glycosyl hydrolase